MNCISCDICVYHLGLCVFFPGVFLSSRVTGTCPVTTDLIIRVNVKTTKTTTFEVGDFTKIPSELILNICTPCVIFHMIENSRTSSGIDEPCATEKLQARTGGQKGQHLMTRLVH